MGWVDQRRVTRTRLATYPKPPLRTLLTSIKLLALRVNVFHIKNILKQNAGHGKRATRVARGLSVQAQLGVHAPPRAEKMKGEGKVGPEEPRQGGKLTHAHGQAALRPLPSPNSRGFRTSAPNDCFRETSVLRAGLRPDSSALGRDHRRETPPPAKVARFLALC